MVDVVGVGMDVPVELLDIVTRLFATHSEDFIDGNFAVFPELEAKMGQVGAGRAGWACKIEIEDTSDPNEQEGFSNCLWCRRLMFDC